MPALHAMHVAFEVAFVSEEKYPAGHFVQFEGEYAPSEDPKLPARQSRQTDEPVTLAEYVPFGHSLHDEMLVASGVSEYVPTGQLAHADG